MLFDGSGRRVEYLRLSVTDRCDLRCSYCMPPGFRGFLAHDDVLRFEEILRVVRVFAALGVARVRLTGGEPLVRKGLAELASGIAAVPGIADLSLSTNGTRLALHAASLRDAGVNRLNVSLDSVDAARVREITGRDVLEHVLAGLAAAKAAGFAPIKINMVLLEGTAQAQVDAMARFCIEHGFILRLIERMPIGLAAGHAGTADLRHVRERLQARYDLVDGVVPGGGPARYLVSRDGRFSVGFITPLSQHFCATCNRVRLTAEGMLHLCLGREGRIDLRRLLRAGASDADLAAAVVAGLKRKPERHDFGNPERRIIRVMAATGG
jgi:cyclic pyranopterin phosphate synthase